MTLHRITDTLFDRTTTTEVYSMIPETLARIRDDDLRAEAERQRLARRVGAGRCWRRIADYADRQAQRATRRYE